MGRWGSWFASRVDWRTFCMAFTLLCLAQRAYDLYRTVTHEYYDPSSDVYSVMTKAGPKYFVERDDITADCIENPDGGCAQQ